MLEYLLQLWPTVLTRQTLVVGVIVGVCAYLLFRKRYNMPPGPRGWPLIGNLLDLRKDNMFKVFHKWSRDHGPVITVKFGITKAVILSRIDVVLEALVKRQADFAGRPYSYSTNAFIEGGGDILTATYGPRWKLHRKLVSRRSEYLTGNFLSKQLSESLAISTELMRKETGPFDPYPYITLAVFNILYGMCFNKFSRDTEDEMFGFYINNMTEFFKEFGNGCLEDIFPPLRLCPTGKFKRCHKIVKSLNNAFAHELATHRATLKPAGIDTSRNTLHWTLLAMALHPDIQKKVQEEVDSVIGPSLNVSLTDREKLPYTEAVLHEIMRIRPVAAFGLPHATMCDTTVGGYDVPKDTMVWINHYSLHLDPDQWHNVTEIRPERFLDDSGKMAPKPESWLPFSAGRRVCLGESLAKPELHLILADIMRACSVSLAPGETNDFEPIPLSSQNLPKKYQIVVESRI